MITFDFETRSELDLKKVGAWAYSEHPSTDVICACYQIDAAPMREWWPWGAGGIEKRHGVTPANEMPADLEQALLAGDLIEAHNVSFEFSIWHNIMRHRYGWALPKLAQWRDTMAVACYYALPAPLDRLARALRYEGKDADGSRLITKYSKLHLKTAKRVIPDDDFRKFVDYCRRDVAVEATISDYLGDLPEHELEVFQLDFEVNVRGLYLDLKGIDAATQVADERSAKLAAEFKEIASGIGPLQRDAALAWFRENGIALENMQAEHIEELLKEGDIPQGPPRRALEIRAEINRASTKKLDAMARQIGSDGRARFQSRYHGASTGRNTGAGFQPLNLNRGFEEQELADGSKWPTPEQLVSDIMHRQSEWLDCVYGDAMDALGKASRHWIMAQPGNRIRSGDFVSVEAVILACLAGEEWKVKAFRDGVGIYEMMAEKIYSLPPGTVSKKTHPKERQDGKTGELAFGYQGALNAWLNFDSSGRHSDQRIVEICRAWRKEHPATVRYWRGTEEACVQAVEHPGRRTEHRGIGFEIVDEWLTMILLDGKRLWYREPRISLKMPQWHKPLLPTRIVKDEDGEEYEEANPCHTGDCTCEPQPQVTYMAWKFGAWRRVATYGGKLTENAVQALSRQRLKPSRLRLRRAGYNEILSVYDEIVTENKEGFGSLDEFKQIMLEPAGKWDRDWPIRVDAWEGIRYKK